MDNEYGKKYYLENKEKMDNYSKEWKIKNKEAWNKYQAAYKRKKWQEKKALELEMKKSTPNNDVD